MGGGMILFLQASMKKDVLEKVLTLPPTFLNTRDMLLRPTQIF